MSLGGKAAGDISRMWPSRPTAATSRGMSTHSVHSRDQMREGSQAHQADPKPGDWERFLRITGQLPAPSIPAAPSTVVVKSPTQIQTPIKIPPPRAVVPTSPRTVPLEERNDMSMLRDFGQSLLGIATQRIAQRAGVLPGAGPQPAAQAGFISLPPALGPVVSGAGRVLTSPAGRRAAGTVIATAAGVGAGNVMTGGGAGTSSNGCPSGYHPAKDGSGRCVRNRYMNYGNARAARRAVRRIKGARRLLQDIERQLPKRTVRSRAASGAHKH